MPGPFPSSQRPTSAVFACTSLPLASRLFFVYDFDAELAAFRVVLEQLAALGDDHVVMGREPIQVVIVDPDFIRRDVVGYARARPAHAAAGAFGVRQRRHGDFLASPESSLPFKGFEVLAPRPESNSSAGSDSSVVDGSDTKLDDALSLADEDSPFPLDLPAIPKPPVRTAATTTAAMTATTTRATTGAVRLPLPLTCGWGGTCCIGHSFADCGCAARFVGASSCAPHFVQNEALSETWFPHEWQNIERSPSRFSKIISPG